MLWPPMGDGQGINYFEDCPLRAGYASAKTPPRARWDSGLGSSSIRGAGSTRPRHKKGCSGNPTTPVIRLTGIVTPERLAVGPTRTPKPEGGGLAAQVRRSSSVPSRNQNSMSPSKGENSHLCISVTRHRRALRVTRNPLEGLHHHHARDAIGEAGQLVGEGDEPRVLEPSPPTVINDGGSTMTQPMEATLDWRRVSDASP